MQGYRSHTATLHGGHCPGALSPCSMQGLTRGRTGLVHDPSLPIPFHHQPTVPVSPGHVRPLHPYPPSRRRRR
jgi:hypothetical protein